MNNTSYEDEYEVHDVSGFLAGLVFFAGLLLGGLIGAGVMLLLAPQSGKKTRKQILRKSRDLRVQTTDAIEDGVAQVQAKAHQVSTSIHEQAEALQQHGRDVLDEGKERFAMVVEAGNAAVHGA